MGKPKVELLWWDGCPSTERAVAQLRKTLDEVGLNDVEIEKRQIHSEADARELGFPGSPTILLNGVDVLPPGPQEPVGLTCRVYRRRDGRVSSIPDPVDLREAMERAMDHAPVAE